MICIQRCRFSSRAKKDKCKGGGGSTRNKKFANNFCTAATANPSDKYNKLCAEDEGRFLSTYLSDVYLS
jgi:hypothetical protein